MKTGIKIALSLVLLSSLSFASEQFAMSDSDRAMYADMLENNPGEMMVANGEELIGDIGGDAALAKYLGVSEDNLPKYIAGFPRYIKKFDKVVGLGQALQAMLHDGGHKVLKLKSSDMFDMIAYTKSLANDERININVNENQAMKDSYALGKKVYEIKTGARGLSCLSCHSKEAIGKILRTQPLPDLGVNNAAGTWPGYRMVKSKLVTFQGRMQECMKSALLAVVPLGSPEIVGLEVYVTEKSKGKKMAIPGLKR